MLRITGRSIRGHVGPTARLGAGGILTAVGRGVVTPLATTVVIPRRVTPVAH